MSISTLFSAFPNVNFVNICTFAAIKFQSYQLVKLTTELTTMPLKFHPCTKFGAKILIDAQIMAQKRNSKWRPPPSWIYFRWLFLLLPTFHFWSQPSYKISWKCFNPWLNYNNFLKFKMAAVVLELLHHKTTRKAPAWGRISLSNFLSIRCTVLKICGFVFLQNWFEMPIHAPNI